MKCIISERHLKFYRKHLSGGREQSALSFQNHLFRAQRSPEQNDAKSPVLSLPLWWPKREACCTQNGLVPEQNWCLKSQRLPIESLQVALGGCGLARPTITGV